MPHRTRLKRRVEQQLCLAACLSQRSLDANTLLEELLGLREIVLIGGQPGSRLRGLQSCRRFGCFCSGVGSGEQGCQPCPPLANQAAALPELSQRPSQPKPNRMVTAITRPAQCCSEIVVFAIELFDHRFCRWTIPLRRGCFGQRYVVARVRSLERFCLATQRQLLQGILANGLQQGEARICRRVRQGSRWRSGTHQPHE